MKRFFLPLCMLLAAAGRAASRNPDRWATLEASQGGMSSVKGDLTVHTKIADVDETEKTMNVNAGISFLLPATDAWSFQAGVGGDWTEQDIIGPLTNGGATSNKNVGSASLSARHFFEGGRPTGKNPDQWPSLALTAGGANTLHYDAGNAAGAKDKKVSSRESDFSLDARWPLGDAWTATFSAGGKRATSAFDPAPLVNGIADVAATGFVNAGFRWFWVGHNMILDDAGENPDRWVMVFASAGVNKDSSNVQTVRNLAGVKGQRDVDSRGAAFNVGLRLPATAHLSLRLEASGATGKTVVPILAVPAQSGAVTRLSSVGFSAAVRYFF